MPTTKHILINDTTTLSNYPTIHHVNELLQHSKDFNNYNELDKISTDYRDHEDDIPAGHYYITVRFYHNFVRRLKIRIFKISITEYHSTTVHINIEKPMNYENFNDLPPEYNGQYHNFNGVEGYAVEKAVKKLFGKNAYWFGSHTDYRSGQVFKPLKGFVGTSTSLTSQTYLDIEEIY